MKIIIAVLLLTSALVSAKFEMKHGGACGVPLDILLIYREYVKRFKDYVGVELKPACELFEQANRGWISDRMVFQTCREIKLDKHANPYDMIRSLVKELPLVKDTSYRSYGCGFSAWPANDSQDQWRFCCYHSPNTYE
ncbi:hypothetical protein Q1695_008130 [Nippostrongylus brasiliensis]|nr:hypothetical protein Q1695_008130 [Nippostrongylus brasiliensis]